MELTTAEEVHDALRGEVTIRRVKRHFTRRITRIRIQSRLKRLMWRGAEARGC